VLEFGEAIEQSRMRVELLIETYNIARTSAHPRGVGAARNVQVGEQIGIAGSRDELPNAGVVGALNRSATGGTWECPRASELDFTRRKQATLRALHQTPLTTRASFIVLQAEDVPLLVPRGARNRPREGEST